MPFFVTWEGRIEPGVTGEPVWLLDIFPTAAELAGAEIGHVIDGISLVPLLERRPGEFAGHESFYWQKRNEQAVRMGPWKAFREHPDKPVELFLIEDDTYCDRDLAGYYPEIVAEIEAIMVESSVEHPWFLNPGEGDQDLDAKRKRAEEAGQLQIDLIGNTAR